MFSFCSDNNIMIDLTDTMIDLNIGLILVVLHRNCDNLKSLWIYLWFVMTLCYKPNQTNCYLQDRFALCLTLASTC